MINSTDFKELIQKYLDGKANKEEEAKLFRYYEALQKHKQWNTSEMGNEEATINSLFTRILGEINDIEKRSFFTHKWRIAATAAILLAVLSAGLLLVNRPPVNNQVETPHIINDFSPGTNKAILNLSDGSKVMLNDTNHISHNQSGEILTPKGSQYNMTLPDGSKVWLNAASSLKFPAQFTGKERIVELTGEAYFEIAKNKNMPFKVLLNGAEIEVLGTHFNVMSYADEKSIRTTLLEGSVKITKGDESKTLIPGEQAIIEENIQVSGFNAEDVMAWKNGYFIFADEGIESIMRKISRWYNADIEYHGEIPNKSFTGKILRSENVSVVLEKLQLTGSVRFKIEKEEGRIIVMK